MLELDRNLKGKQPHQTSVNLGADDRIYICITFDDGSKIEIPYRPDEADALAKMLQQGAMMTRGIKA